MKPSPRRHRYSAHRSMRCQRSIHMYQLHESKPRKKRNAFCTKLVVSWVLLAPLLCSSRLASQTVIIGSLVVREILSPVRVRAPQLTAFLYSPASVTCRKSRTLPTVLFYGRTRQWCCRQHSWACHMEQQQHKEPGRVV